MEENKFNLCFGVVIVVVVFFLIIYFFGLFDIDNYVKRGYIVYGILCNVF